MTAPGPSDGQPLDIDCRPPSRWRYPAWERAVTLGDWLLRIGSWFAALRWPSTKVKGLEELQEQDEVRARAEDSRRRGPE